MNKFNIVPSSDKPYKVVLVSPVIDDDSTHLSTTESVAPDKKNLKKKMDHRLEKCLKLIMGEYSDPKKLDSHDKESDKDAEELDTTFSGKS